MVAVTGVVVAAAVAVVGVSGSTVGHALWRDWPAVTPPEAIAAGVGGAVLVGVVAGVHPSVRASRLTPTEALAAQ